MEEMIARWIRETLYEYDQAKKNVNLFRMKEMVILHNSLKLMRDELTASKRK
jgi:hypothetical protein